MGLFYTVSFCSTVTQHLFLREIESSSKSPISDFVDLLSSEHQTYRAFTAHYLGSAASPIQKLSPSFRLDRLDRHFVSETPTGAFLRLVIRRVRSPMRSYVYTVLQTKHL